METGRYIITWRKHDSPLEWDHHVCEDIDEMKKALESLLKRGVHQYHTFPLGELLTEYSSRY